MANARVHAFHPAIIELMRWVPLFLSTALTVSALLAQSTASFSGQVIDPNGAAIANASITLSNALTNHSQQTRSQSDGSFSITNIPLQTYTVTVEMPGFAPEHRIVALRSNVPVAQSIRLRLAGQATRMDVSETESTTLVEPESTGTRTELSATAFAKMPSQAGNRGLESILLSFPGFAANANGAIHPRGAHNQMTYVIDGMPVGDQLTGSFANAVDPSIVQNIELYTGNVPAEFGSKVSGVAVITPGTGVGRPSSSSATIVT